MNEPSPSSHEEARFLSWIAALGLIAIVFFVGAADATRPTLVAIAVVILGIAWMIDALKLYRPTSKDPYE